GDWSSDVCSSDLVARDAGQAQQHTSRPTVAAGKQIVEHRFRPLGESRRRRIRGRGVEVAGRSRVGEIALQQPHEIFGDLQIARLARRLAGRETRPGDLHLILKQRAYRRARPGDVEIGRASCRERAWSAGGDESVKKKTESR